MTLFVTLDDLASAMLERRAQITGREPRHEAAEVLRESLEAWFDMTERRAAFRRWLVAAESLST